MLFVTYLRHELRNRLRQAIVIGTGLAVGTGLVITVSAASAGVRTAQANVLRTLYGVGTGMTVTRAPRGAGTGTPRLRATAVVQHLDLLAVADRGVFGARAVAAIAALPHVTGVVSWLTLVDTKLTIPARSHPVSTARSGSTGPPPLPERIAVDGVDTAHPRGGPLGQATVVRGRALTAADANADVALVDAAYAASGHVTAGSVITLAKTRFTVAGIVRQPPGAAADVLIPLARAQALSGLRHEVSAVAVAADSTVDVAAVSREITRVFGWAQVASSASLAEAITGSLATTARLATDLGRWVSVAALLAAVALASLLTLGAVGRRVRELGTLKALGWRTSRVVVQVIGESAAIGVAGALAGIAVGLGGAALVSAVAPALSATAGSATVPVRLTAPVTVVPVVLAVTLGVAGGLLAGTIGGWRAARLRPADALARVG
jgi:putative ABC transport system permease protein